MPPTKTVSEEFLPGSFHMVEFVDLRRTQVVFSVSGMAYDEAIEGAIEIIGREYGETPQLGERIRVSGPYKVGADMSRQFVFPWGCSPPCNCRR